MAHWRIVNGKAKHVHNDLSVHDTSKDIRTYAGSLAGFTTVIKSEVETSCNSCGAIQKQTDSVVRR